MDIIKESQKQTLSPTPTTTIHEYATRDGFISGATAEIKGRYPTQGYVINQKIKELVYVLAGSGSILTPTGATPIATGDVLFIDHGEKFAWEGNMVLFMATTPTFDPTQHIEVA